MHKPKRLFIDIETSPDIIAAWGVYEQNAVWVEEDWRIISFAAKWSGKKTVAFHNHKDDKVLMKKLHSLLDEADIVIAHNGDRFDIKKINARMLIHGIKPPRPYKTVDTRKIAKKYFGFSSNALDALARQFGVGRKMQTGGHELWRQCREGNKKAWAKMIKYNKQDVDLLEKVYEKMLGWSDSHPNMNLYADVSHLVCPKCGGSQFQKRGMARTLTRIYPRYQCLTCGGWSRGSGEPAEKIDLRV